MKIWFMIKIAQKKEKLIQLIYSNFMEIGIKASDIIEAEKQIANLTREKVDGNE